MLAVRKDDFARDCWLIVSLPLARKSFSRQVVVFYVRKDGLLNLHPKLCRNVLEIFLPRHQKRRGRIG